MSASLCFNQIARAAIVGVLWWISTKPGHAAPPDFRARPAAQTPKPAVPGLYAHPDDAFLAARQAAIQGQNAVLEQAAPHITPSHPLRVYLDYWRLRAQLNDDPIGTHTDAHAQAFIDHHANTLIGDLARRDWLQSLGRRQAWEQVVLVAKNLSPPVDTNLQCLILLAQGAEGLAVIQTARPLLMAPRELGDSCQRLLETASARDWLTSADRATRWERALESGSESAIRQALEWADPPLSANDLKSAWNAPTRLLKAPGSASRAMLALVSLARTDPAEAAARLSQNPAWLKPDQRAFIWSQIATRGIQKLHPDAHAWAQKARTATPSDETLAALARAALRAQDWPALRKTIERMSPATRQDPTWVYWLARALHADTQHPEAQRRGHSLLSSLAGHPHFYGQLASEELGLPHRVPTKPLPPTRAELSAAENNPGLARAMHFYELGLRQDGHREWGFVIRAMNDRELLAAAEWARQRGFLDRTVHAAERTREEHDFSLRYPTPFSDRLAPIAREHEIDLAWIYGLIRQESRFVSDARSAVGATGLMQIMPARHRDFDTQRLHELDTNLQFGTFYLRSVFERFERSAVLASAGYNAGPSRARAWQNTLTRPMEGAIFAETIPFSETRGYVKHVLSNTVWYAAMLTQKPQSIKAWLGVIMPNTNTVSDN